MNIEFNIYKLKPDSDTYEKWSKQKYMQQEIDREIVIVGEETVGNKLYLKGCTIREKGLCLIGGLMLNDVAYLIPEEDIERTSLIEQYDIPKKYLTMEIVEDIQRINERLFA